MNDRLKRQERQLVEETPRGLVTSHLVRAGELLPYGRGKVEVVARAARAHVHDLRLDLVAVVLNLDLLAAPAVGGTAGHGIVGRSTPGRLGKGDDHVSVVEDVTARTGSTGGLVDGDVDVGVLLAR